MTNQFFETIRLTRQDNTRFLVVVEGNRACSVRAVRRLLDETKLEYQWVSGRGWEPDNGGDERWHEMQLTRSQRLGAADIKQLLGSETATLVYDLYDEFDPDVLGIISGLISGGRGLFLLVPPRRQWGELKNRCHQRIASYPYTSEQGRPNTFLRMLARLSVKSGIFWGHATEKGIDWAEIAGNSGSANPEVTPGILCDSSELDVSRPFSQFAINREQDTVVKTVVNQVVAKKRDPVILTANRGRGKSYAMGIAASLLCQGGAYRIVVCSSRPASVATVFNSFICCAKTGRYQRKSETELRHINSDGQKSSLEYWSPDRLLNERPTLDLLIVDEAATLPVFILKQLLDGFYPVVFSTTVHGYEGAGKGFAINFKKHLFETCAHWHELTLSTPVRWAANDTLESILFDALLLDAEAAEITPDKLRLVNNGEEKTGSIISDKISYREWRVPDMAGICTSTPAGSLPKMSAAWDDNELRQIFGLLIQAHYQTRPLDLMRLLDIPGQRLVIATFCGMVVGVLWAVEEGGYQGADQLEEQIWSGKRRPAGHLVPHSLVCHEGFRSVVSLSSLRITRIVVHPALQGRGIGSAMVDRLHDLAKCDYDYLSTSYALTSDVLSFWHKNRFQLLRIGVQPDNISGLHSCMMGMTTSKRATDLFQRVSRKLGWQLPLNLLTGLANLEPAVVIHFFLTLPARPLEEVVKPEVISDVRAFAFGNRSYETCQQSLWLYSWSNLFRPVAVKSGEVKGGKIKSGKNDMNDDAFGQNGPAIKPGAIELSMIQLNLLVARVVMGRPWARVVELTGLDGKKQCVNILRDLFKKSPTG
ncbi:MAG: hypothetical protein CSB48_00220 [Proteobacteria bacterium]|nr:MAG: hypothetical protein CSB48_00220 [Pseudomonadota bacterium]